MRFVQFYFGLPLAMVLLSVAFVPRFYRLKVFTAYEYLEARFDLKTRQLTALLFLLQRGLSAGITIYAPAIILSKVLGWSLNLTNVAIGGARHRLHGLGRHARGQPDAEAADGGDAGRHGGGVLRDRPSPALPADLSFGDAVASPASLGKMNIVDFSPRPRQPLHALDGPDGRALRGAGVLRHRPVAGAALSVGALGDREPPRPAVQRPAQGPDAGADPVRRRHGVRVLPVQPAAGVLQREPSCARVDATRAAAEMRQLEAAHARRVRRESAAGPRQGARGAARRAARRGGPGAARGGRARRGRARRRCAPRRAR